MKICVTGGAGFIGSTTVDRLIQAGDQVTIIDNLSTGKTANINPAATFIELDITSPDLRDCFAEHRCDAVMHCAAQIDVRKSVEDPIADAGTNILGSLNVLEAACASGVRRFCFSSTGGAIYGDTPNRPTPVGEECKPISPYGITKLTIEKYLHYYALQHGLSWFALRYGNVYGPRQNPHGEAGVVAIFAQRMLAGEPLQINGDGLQTRDYVFVTDVAEANTRALHADMTAIANVGTGVESDVNFLFHVLNDALEAGRDEVHGPAMPGEQKTSCLHWKATQDLLGWEPTVSFEEGLRKTAAWFKDGYQKA
jgi:UDP-glucose 4-epimerase